MQSIRILISAKLLLAGLFRADLLVNALHDLSLKRTNRDGVAVHQPGLAKNAIKTSEGIEAHDSETGGRKLTNTRSPWVVFHERDKLQSADTSNGAKQQYSRHRLQTKIIMIGGPASGKGTQCETIARRYGLVHLSTGDMLREACKNGSDIGRIAKEYMDKGELVPDDLMMKIVERRLQQEDCQRQGWLLDGFPRTRIQAESLKRMGIEADLVVFLDVPDDVLIDRVLGRRQDPETGKIYHLAYRPPPAEILDRLQQRSDDTLESIQRRLRNFHAQVSDVRTAIGKHLVEVDGTEDSETVSALISDAIEHTMKRKQVKA